MELQQINSSDGEVVGLLWGDELEDFPTELSELIKNYKPKKGGRDFSPKEVSKGKLKKKAKPTEAKGKVEKSKDKGKGKK